MVRNSPFSDLFHKTLQFEVCKFVVFLAHTISFIKVLKVQFLFTDYKIFDLHIQILQTPLSKFV